MHGTKTQHELNRRESIYREAILANSVGFMEINLSKNLVISRLRNDWNAGTTKGPAGVENDKPVPYDEFGTWWAEHNLASDKEAFCAFGNHKNLIRYFEDGQRIVSDVFEVMMKDGHPSTWRQTYYLSQDEETDDIVAICVVYDLSQQERHKREMSEMKETLDRMRMRNFVSQMHPHFLYNALGSIRELVLTDPEYGADMLYDFTMHLRAGIRALSNDDEIPFTQELENIQAYVNIETMRFGDRLKVVYDIGADDFMVIPFGIQPIVENAIKHGVFQKGFEEGTVTLRTREAEDCWEVLVEDDGVGFDVDEVRRRIDAGEKDSTGLRNLMFRLENIMDAKVELISSVGSGTTVTVRIPKEKPPKRKAQRR